MRRITLNFYKGRIENRVAGKALLALGVLVGIGLLIWHDALKTEQARVKAKLAQQLNRQKEVSAAIESREIEPQLQRAAGVIEQLSFPWDALFRALETNVNEDVVLLSVVPDVKGGTITLNAEARDWTAMQEYIRRLGKESFFTEVSLVSHQIQVADPQRPVRFVLMCGWLVAKRQ